MTASYKFIYLASQSPRRQELLRQLDVDFQQVENDFDETVLPNELAEQYVSRLAKGKALAATQKLQVFDAPVLSADTVVVLDGECLGKPKNAIDAAQMLARLSGKKHQVMTSVFVCDQVQQAQALSVSSVMFDRLNDAMIEAYCKTLEPLDKAGSYAIQGKAASFIKRLEGSYSGVMGLPLFETRQLLDKFGVKSFLNYQNS